MKRIPKLAIYVSIFNSEKTIFRCLKSIDAQRTEFELEIVCIDDASTDNTQKLIQQFSLTSFWPVKMVFHKENQRSQNIRYFVEYIFPKMDADFFTIIDGDDYLFDNPRRFQNMISALLLNENCSFCFTDTKHVSSNEDKAKFALPEPLKRSYIVSSEKFFLLGNYSGIHLGACVFRNLNFDFPQEYFLQSNGDMFYPYLWGKWGDAVFLDNSGHLVYQSENGSYSSLSREQKEINRLVFACQFSSMLLKEGNIEAAIFVADRFLPIIANNHSFKALFERKL
jgi:glycosyltransferase involved in cell wall biosynthesis